MWREEKLGVYIEKIFERATIRGIPDYLLFGIGLDKDNIVSVSYIRNTL
jgi:hypothetical protein